MAFKDKVDSKETLMAYQFVTYEKRGRIAIVTFDRPERMNALHPPCHAELDEIWNDFERDPALWVAILTGAGDKAFSAGASRWRWPATSSSPPITPGSGCPRCEWA